MKSFVSVYTLSIFDNILNSYRKKILRDFYDNYLDTKIKQKIDYHTFENEFIERRKQNFRSKEIPINYNKCMARIWNSKIGCGVQCCNNKKKGDFCIRHSKVLNYGRIDKKL